MVNAEIKKVKKYCQYGSLERYRSVYLLSSSLLTGIEQD